MNAMSVFIIVSAVAMSCEASAFLRPHVRAESEDHTRDRVLRSLLSELATETDQLGLQELEAELAPMYAALPKGVQHGELEPSTVRYALHRYFVQKHGWNMKGLEAGRGANASLAPEIGAIFGQSLHGRGTSLARLALLAAKLTDLVQKEAVQNLANLYTALKLSATSRIKKKDAEAAFKWYLVMYLLGDSTEGVDRQQLVAAERDIIDMYPAWRSVKMWSKDLDQTLAFNQKPRRNPFLDADVSFEQSSTKVQELGNHFGSFQKLECQSLKGALMEMELGGSGRVALADFYQVGLKEDWQFNENAEYLRSLGALDESDPKRPSIFIPNYLHSQTNCLSTSGFYSVCCTNECEGLLGHLERELAAPRASPARLAALVGQLESDTVAAPRNLSSVQLARLGQIAELHGGEVPLHGRLFAQWMHHAYPRECPFPHLAGSTSTLSQEEWHRSTGGESPLATKEDMQRRAAAPGAGLLPEQQEELQPLPWFDIEELVAPSQTSPQPSASCFLLRLAAAALLASSSLAFRSVLSRKTLRSSAEAKMERFLV